MPIFERLRNKCMKRNPTPENLSLRKKAAEKRSAGRFAASSANGFRAWEIGPTAFSHLNALTMTKAEIRRTAQSIKQAGCRDVLIVYTPEYVRFIVATQIPLVIYL